MRNREILNLGMVSGPVVLKIKGQSWIFILLGFKKTKQNEQITKKWDEIRQMLVSGALDDTKTIGKAGVDIFANFGAEKP